MRHSLGPIGFRFDWPDTARRIANDEQLRMIRVNYLALAIVANDPF